MITTEQILNNYSKYIELLKKHSGTRFDKIKLIIKEIGEEEFAMTPAAPKKHYHGAYPGGLLLHSLNVYNFSSKLYDLWKECDSNMNGYTKDELLFCALLHDLGKCGNANQPYYIPSTDEWRKNKLGEVYSYNPDISNMRHSERSLYTLQKYGVELSENEFIGIMVHDGLFDVRNEMYYKTISQDQIFKNNLPIILHQADYMSYRIELEQENKNLFK